MHEMDWIGTKCKHNGIRMQAGRCENGVLVRILASSNDHFMKKYLLKCTACI